MTISLEKLSEIISTVREQPAEPVTHETTFEKLEMDSLNKLMVLLSVGQECSIGDDITEKQLVELVYKVQTIGDVIKYVESYPS